MKKTLLNLRDKAYKLDAWAINFVQTYGLTALRLALGVTFIWFGGLKPFGLSPAQDLVAATVYWSEPEIIVPLIGLWEVAIGVCLLYPPLTRIGLALLALQMPGTFLPLVLLPEVCFTVFPLGLTLEGQYIVKNLVIIGSALIVGSTIKPLKEAKQ
jgi:uncharacterized membrane protein YphA (DoxX/SURF4 family)